MSKRKRDIYNEEQLGSLSKNDDYVRGKRIKDVAIYGLLVIFIFLGLVFAAAVLFDLETRNVVLAEIRNNLIALFLSSLYILGIPRRKEQD